MNKRNRKYHSMNKPWLPGKRWRHTTTGVMAVLLIASAFFLLWWMGFFLPQSIIWQVKKFAYTDLTAELSEGELCLYMKNTSSGNGVPEEVANQEEYEDDKSPGEYKKVIRSGECAESEVIFRTKWDWSVQDVLCYDINRDGEEELVMLVWKHGSYGKYRPIWVKHNDIRLEQHIFIYQRDEKSEDGVRAVWMSSSIGTGIRSIARGSGSKLVLTDSEGKSTAWSWQDFGLKLVGDAKEASADILCAGDNLIHTSLLSGNPLLRVKSEVTENNAPLAGAETEASDTEHYAPLAGVEPEASDTEYNSPLAGVEPEASDTEHYAYFYRVIQEEVERADLATINLETVLVKDYGLVSDYPRFGTPLAVGEAVAAAGFDVMTLANNHILDKGLYGVGITTDFCDENQMQYVGVNRDGGEDIKQAVLLTEVNGIHIAILNYTYGTNGIPLPEDQPYLVERLPQVDLVCETENPQRDDDSGQLDFENELLVNRMKEQLEYARMRADCVLVFVHWGEEYSHHPSSDQYSLCSLFWSYGVDVVIGTHPHVLQPCMVWTANSCEEVNTELMSKEQDAPETRGAIMNLEKSEAWDANHRMQVFFSLGNLISGQEYEKCGNGGLAEFTIHKDADGSIAIENSQMKEIYTDRSGGKYQIRFTKEYDY